MHLLKILLPLLFLSTLSASVTDLTPSPLHGSVHVMTGQYVEEAPQIVLHSPFALGLVRRYVGPDKDRSTVCWSFGPASLSLLQGEANTLHHLGLFLNDPTNGRVSYKQEGEQWVPALLKAWSQNDRLELSKDSRQPIAFDLQSWHGDRLHFSSPHAAERDFLGRTGWRTLLLDRIDEANGRQAVVTYEKSSGFEDCPFIRSMKLYGPTHQELGSITHQAHRGNAHTLESSDGQSVRYALDGEGRLARVERPGRLPIMYEYKKSDDTAKEFPQNRNRSLLTLRREGDFYLGNDYYTVGRHWTGIESRRFEFAEGKQHPAINCIRRQVAPLGRNGEEVAVATFDYHFNPHHVRSAGFTDVRDAEGNRTRYTWEDGHKLSWIDRFQGESELLMREHYLYKGVFETPVGKVVYEGDRPVLAITHRYDERGRLVCEKIWGDLTGRSASLALDPFGFPEDNGINCLCRELGYSDDHRLVEERRGERRIVYSYEGKSRQPSFVALYHRNELIEQTALVYDINGALIERERTCGSRTYQQTIARSTEGAKIGLPERLEEYVNGEFIGAIEWAYGRYHLPVSETRYGSDNKPLYTLRAQYDEAGRPIWTSDPMGNRISFVYDCQGRLIAKQGPRPECITTYAYDQANRLIARTQGGLAERYAYNSSSRLEETTSPFGEVTTYRYNGLGQRVEQCLFDGTLIEVDPLPVHPIERRFAELNREISRALGEAPPPVEYRKRGPQQFYTYDIFGNPTRIVNEIGEVEERRYTVRGQLAESRLLDRVGEEVAGTKESYEYNLDGNLICKVNRIGVATRATYNERGQPTFIEEVDAKGNRGKELTLTYDGDLLTSSSDGTATTLFRYDRVGRLIEMERGERLTQFSYDAIGRQIRQRVWSCKEEYIDTLWVYDLGSRITQERIEDSEGRVWGRVDYTPDAAGNVIAVATYGEGGRPEIIRYEYNALNQCIKATDPLGSVTTHAHGEEELCTDALGNSTRQRYDELGRLTSVEQLDRSGSRIAGVEYSYDAAGRLVAESHLVLPGSEKKQTTQYEYGPGGRLLAICEPMGKTTRFAYGDRGFCSTKTLPGGQVIEYGYDGFGRLASEIGPDYFYEYRYDARGNLVSARGGDGETLRSYDGYNQLTEERLSNGLKVRYDYDRLGRCVATYLPDGSVVHYTHDPMGVAKVSRNLFSREVVRRDLSGRPLLERGEPGGLEWSYRWDLVGRQIGEHSPDGLLDQTYDRLGRLTQARGRDGGGPFEESYSYDGLSQLTGESGSWSHSWQYDSLGNRSIVDGAPCGWDLLNRRNVLHDQNHRVQNIGKRACDYDARGRLILINNDKGQRWRYTYDALNRRVREVYTTGAVSVERRYLYDGDVEIGCCEQGRDCYRLMMERSGWERPRTVGMEVDGQLYSVGTTSRGDIAALFDLSGRCVESMRYSSFGERERFGESISPWGFAGKRHDPSGFVYFGRRYYLPSEGRWMAPDPYGPIDGPNLYQFCHNNPHAFIDWVGLYSETFVMGGCGGSCGPDYVGSSQTTVNTRIYFGDTRPSGFGGSGVIGGGSMAGLHNPVHFAGFGAFGHTVGGLESHLGRMAGAYGAFPSLGAQIIGSLKLVGGACEVVAGGALAYYSGGALAFVGGIIVAHGFDHALAGTKTIWTGEQHNTLACMGLEATGIPHEWAIAIDDGISAGLTLGSEAAVLFQRSCITAYVLQHAPMPAGAFTSQMKSSIPSPSVQRGVIVEASMPLGRRGTPLMNAKVQPFRNTAATINGRKYTGHALDQMQNRGIVPSVVENAIKKGTVFATRNGTIGYYDAVNEVRVIVDGASGRVVTVIPGLP